MDAKIGYVADAVVNSTETLHRHAEADAVTRKPLVGGDEKLFDPTVMSCTIANCLTSLSI